MRSPVQALIWEQWRQVRWIVVSGLALTWAGSYSVHRFIQSQYPGFTNVWLELSTLFVAMSLLLLMATLVFTHSNAKDLRMNVPARMLTLPVRGVTLAVAQVGFRLALMLAMCLLLPLGLACIDSSYLWITPAVAGVAIAAFSYSSAVGLTIGRRSPTGAVAVALISYIPILWTLEWINLYLPSGWQEVRAPYFGFALCCGVVAFMSVVSARRGTVRGWFESLPAFHVPPASFILHRSPMLWIELRRSALWIPLGTFASVTILFASTFLLYEGAMRHIARNAGLAIYSTALLGPWICGICLGLILLARESRDAASGFARNTWTRPQTVEAIVLGRMGASAISLLGTYVPFGLLAASVGYFGLNGGIEGYEFGLSSAVLYVALLFAAWNLIWVPFLPVAYWLLVMPYIALVESGIVGVSGGDSIFMEFIPSVVFLLVFVMIARTAARRRLFRRKTIGVYAGLSALVMVAGCVFAATRMERITLWTLVDYGTMIAAIGLIPMFSLLWQGVFLDRVRHGGMFRRLPARGE